MYVVLAWFSDRTLSEGERHAGRVRFESAVSDVVPETYLRHESGGADWGVTVLHPGEQGAYRWPMVATEDAVTAVSLGLPVGADATGGPVALARRLLSGGDVHREVVPPFGLLALDRDERFAVQQDWLGMCRLFTGTANGITAMCSRPSALATFLHGTVEPDLEGWASYAICAQFGGDLSPIRGVRLLQPGERVTGQRRSGGGWTLANQRGYGVDDVVMSGLAAQGRPVGESLDLAAQAITTTASSVGDLYADQMSLGLSGGKDSRLIAASLIAAGQLPKFITNEDTAAEGEVARELTKILRDKHGLQPDHELVRSGAPASVLNVGLHQRTAQLQRRYDFQFPSTYTARPAVPALLAVNAAPPSFSGAAGELATGYWYPEVDGEAPEQLALTRLMSGVPGDVATESAAASQRARINGLIDHAKSIGLSDLHLLDYIFLMERVRRWSTSAYSVGRVTPLLSPGFIATTFALTVDQKRAWLLHTELIKRLVPEWSEVPFVRVTTGKSTAVRVWEGDGVQVIADLLDTAHGPITQLIRRDAVEKALRTVVRKKRGDQHALRQFTWLAVASQQLEPGTARPSTSATYARVTAPPKPKPAKPAKPPVKRWRSRLRWVKKTWLWKALHRK
jgi:asparagine synthase (glutamine-hydrolysing)